MTKLYNILAYSALGLAALVVLNDTQLPERTSPMPRNADTNECEVPTDWAGNPTLEGNSVARYMKCIISPDPLTPEEAENLPSFEGEPYPAPPFFNQV